VLGPGVVTVAGQGPGWCTGRVVVPLVFRHGAAEVAFTVALAVWLVFEFVMRVRQHLQSKGPASVDRSAFILVPCLVGCVVLAEVLGRRGGLPWPGGLVWPVVAGLVLIGAGIGLRAWSIATLGRFFQYWIKIQPGHRVVTGGPYHYVRHPSYTGIALVLTGLALACDDVWSLVAVAALGGAGLAVRILAEERQLTESLGPEYEQFAAGRKRLVPGVW
jgi:protein-S-isoprenylcysteine O-methyltransferase Ste14